MCVPLFIGIKYVMLAGILRGAEVVAPYNCEIFLREAEGDLPYKMSRNGAEKFSCHKAVGKFASDAYPMYARRTNFPTTQ